MINIIKSIILPSLTAYIVCSIIFNNWNYYSANFGSLWVNINSFYLIIIGVLLLSVFNYSKNTFVKYLLILIVFILFVLSFSGIKSASLTVYYIFLLVFYYLYKAIFSITQKE